MTAQGAMPGAVILLAWGLLLLPTAARAELPEGHRADQSEACLVCHDLEEELALPVQHAPIEAGECAACHNPHVSRFDALLRERPATLCLECHDDLGEALAREVVHEPVADGRCSDCHEPHGGKHPGLLAKPGAELCGDCHSKLTEWTARPVQHPPFAEGSCDACHDPHAADHPALAAEAGGGMCVTCHPANADFQRVHGGYPVEQARCGQCHDPHASAREGLFRASLHAPFEGGDCTTCHVASTSSDPFALLEKEDRLCGECHEDQVELSRTSPFPHVSAGGGRCTDCHNPHSGDGDNLLKAELTALCTACHDPGGSSSGQDGRYVTHAGQDCTTCHAPHGGEQPLLLAEDSVELCGTCHTHEHGIRHPLGEETRDPRSGNPMTCLSCHGVHDAPYKMYLLGSEERDLCLGCHKEIGGRR